MRRWSVLILVTSSACSFGGASSPSDADDGSPLDAALVDGATVDGRRDDAAMADGATAVDADPNLDTDTDTVPDITDNCPLVANPNQRDHDLDNVGDLCDPCPHLDVGLADVDGDGVGDACDPQPGTTNTATFYGFYPGDTLAGWSQGGGWTISGGAAQANQTQMAWQYIAPPGMYTRAYAETSVTVQTLPQSGFAGISIEDGEVWHACGHLGVMSGRSTILYGEWRGNADYDLYEAGSDLGTVIRVAQTTVPDHADCTLVSPLNEIRLEGPAAPATPMAVQIGVDGNAVASFDYLFVVPLMP